MGYSGADLERNIREALAHAGIAFIAEASIGGFRPDFLVRSPHGALIIVEATSDVHRYTDPRTALSLRQSLEKITGVDRVLLVGPGVGHHDTAPGFLSVDQLVGEIQTAFESVRRPALRATVQKESPNVRLLAAMPFKPRFDDVFAVMCSASEDARASCRRVDTDYHSGDIPDRIRQLISECRALVVDLTGSNSNVLFEMGFAQGMKKPTIQICSSPLSKLPLDIRNLNTIPYKVGQTTRLRGPLADAIRTVLSVQDGANSGIGRAT